MKQVKTIKFNGETYRENFEAIVTREIDGNEYILAAFLNKSEAINYAKKKQHNTQSTIHVYQDCKAISEKVQYDRFREIKF